MTDNPYYEMCFDHDEDIEEFAEMIVCPVCEVGRLRAERVELIEKTGKLALEMVCAWAMRHGLSTGHGDNLEMLLAEIGYQIESLRAENEALRQDAEKWRAYKGRKDAVLAAGLGRNPLREGDE